MTNAEAIHSYHTFILPFTIKQDGGDLTPPDKAWVKIGADNPPPYLRDETTRYAYQQYFNHEAKELISQTSANLAVNYRYTGIAPDSVYRILYMTKEHGVLFYDLPIDYIILRHLPQLQAGFLIIAVKNQAYSSLTEMKAINQYGRRIYDPFLPKDKFLLESALDLLILNPADTSDSLELPSQLAYQSYQRQIKTAPRDLLASFFKGFAIFPENIQKESKALEIIVDDRMFVHSLLKVADKGTEELIKDTTCLDSLTLKQQKELYAITYVDKTDSTCQSQDMLKQLLAQSVYSRWSDYSSVYLATQHSFILLANSGLPDFLIQYFLSEYLDLVLIVLSQRVGFLHFSQRAGLAVKDDSEAILSLHEDFVTFKNQFLLPEVSAQEQAIELYALLQSVLYIDKHLSLLDNQLASLNDINQIKMGIASQSRDWFLNTILFVFAAVTLIIDLSNHRHANPSSRLADFLQWFLLIFVVIYLLPKILSWFIKTSKKYCRYAKR